MPKYTTAWLTGSCDLPATTVEVEGAPGVFLKGHWYLYHPTAGLSLIDRLKAILLTEVDGADVYVAKDRRVRITGDGSFDLTWPPSFAALFGFTTNLTGQSTYIAPSVSPLLWSPSKPETPQESPLGTLGRKVYDTRFQTSPDSIQVADSHHVQTVQTFAWSFIPTDRWQTFAQDTNETGTLQGEYTRFFDKVLRNAEKFHLWRAVLEDTTSSDPVEWPEDRLGPYGYRPTRGSITWDFARAPGFKDMERRTSLSLDCLVVPEWSV